MVKEVPNLIVIGGSDESCEIVTGTEWPEIKVYGLATDVSTAMPSYDAAGNSWSMYPRTHAKSYGKSFR